MENSIALKKQHSLFLLTKITRFINSLMGKEGTTSLSHRLSFSIKRLFDISASFIALVLLSPVMLIVALLVKLDSKGDIIFKQERVGKGYKVFTMFKYRSMRQDAELRTGPVWASANDSRITTLGRILRKTRLDETPQLFNILLGDMSLIGPRPERMHFVQQFEEEIADYKERLLVKPGLTGWAQIRHKYDTSVEDVKTKLNYDLYYIHNFSLFFDLKILLGTIPVVLTGKGAH